jgi:alpha-1,2-mannosyltransferase
VRVAGESHDMRRLLAPALGIIAIGFALEVANLVADNRQGIDYDVYWAAGRAVLHGESVFSPWMATQMVHRLPFTYPPFAALCAVPFGLISNRIGFVAWTVLSIVMLGFVVRATTPLLVSRFSRPRVALTLAILVALASAPVMTSLGFGQLGIVLMTMCIFDCVSPRPRWPRGLLIGIATAVKLLPGIFIVYLWLTGRRRAAITATVTAVVLTLGAAVVLPGDSRTFWTSRIFDNSRVGSNSYFSNQSLNGMLRRAFGSHTQLLWVASGVVIAVVGLRYAVQASRRGQEMLGVCLVALVGVLASPVSWVHHLVWIVPVLAVLVGDGTDRRRVALTLALAALFALKLPYLGESFDAGWGQAWFAGPLKDTYGIACLVLLFGLPRLVGARPAPVEPRQPAPAAPASS